VTDVTPIAEKVAKLVCQFDSNNANQRAMAWKALVHTLSTFGADFRDLGNLIECAGENANGALSEAEMQEVYEAGIKEGERRTELKLHSQSNHGAPPPRFPPPRDMAMYCYQRIDDLNDWETEFITNMVALTRRAYPLSIRRQEKLEAIYLKLGGRI
jgi:hypothetical protein